MVSCHCFACTGILRGSSAYRRSKAYCKCQPDNSSFHGCYIYCICARACGMQYHSGSGSVCYNSKGSVFTEGHNRRCRGSFLVAMQKGVARGIFSNEAGLGSAPIAAAAAQTKEPVRQGLVSMTGTFIDTIVICTLTGLSIVLTGAWQVDGLEGVQVTTYAFQNGLPLPKELSAFVLMLCLVFLPLQLYSVGIIIVSGA